MRNQQFLVASCTFPSVKHFFDPSNRVIYKHLRKRTLKFSIALYHDLVKNYYIFDFIQPRLFWESEQFVVVVRWSSEQSYLISDCLKQICHIFVASASASIMPLREARVLKTAWSRRACCLFLPILRQLQSLKMHKWLRIRYRKYSFFVVFSWSDKYRIFNALLKRSNTKNQVLLTQHAALWISLNQEILEY